MKSFVSWLLIFFIAFLFLLPIPSVALETQFKNFTLAPSAPYIDTGIDVNKGDFLDVRRGGNAAIFVSGMSVPWLSTPGDPSCVGDDGYTLPGSPCWSLIARVGSGTPFFAGNGFGEYIQTSGRVYIGINHKLPFSGSGSWSINVVRNFSPLPAPPQPFLRLPWNYNNTAFEKTALTINSFFDHQYPLLSVGLALSEPPIASQSIMLYEGEKTSDAYSSHDGYDWGRQAGASFSAQIRAAAAGCAILRTNCGACGNAILIDHGNYYQTRYYHMQPTGLITNSTTECTNVTQGQQIGSVGFSGNVIPPGEGGAHLHFMVVEDKNKDGNFDDNIPDGLTDPFGWQSTTPDPWPNYTFSYAGMNRTGNDSHYLWLDAIPNLSTDLPTNGGFYEFQNMQLEFPAGSVSEKTKLKVLLGPLGKISDTLEAITNSFIITVQNLFGTTIEQFENHFKLTLSFSDTDLSRIKPETLKIYSSTDGVNWNPEETTLDQTTKTASASLNHLTHFMLTGERVDTQAPETQIVFDPPMTNLIFTSTVSAQLSATDNFSGVDFTSYQLNDDGWQEYSEPLIFSTEGTYILKYRSADLHENIEEIKTVTFTIEKPKDPPEAKLTIDPSKFSIALTATGSSDLTHKTETINPRKTVHTFIDTASNSISLASVESKAFLYDQFSISKIDYNPAQPSTASGSLMVFGFKDRWGILTMTNVWSTPEYKISLTYERFTNRTYVVKTEGRKIVFKETLKGLKFLEIMTNKGMLKYTY